MTDIFERLFTFAPFLRERVVLPGSTAPTVPAADLLAPDRLGPLRARHRAHHPDATPAAVLSLWSMAYFATLAIPGAALAVAGAAPRLGLREVAVLPGDDGTVQAVRLDLGAADPSPEAALARLVDDHLAPVVAALAAEGIVAPRLLWTNAAHYLDWTLREACRHLALPDDRAAALVATVEAPRRPDGTPNPLAGCIRYRPATPHPVRRRKVCCLRTLVPGAKTCGSLCPLPEVNTPS